MKEMTSLMMLFIVIFQKKMTNLLQCITCGKIITAEEGEKHHHCDPIINKHRMISASSFFTVTDENGIMNIVIDGFDHIGYVFVIKEPKLIPIELPCDNYQQPMGNRNKTTDNETEPNFTIVLYYALRKSRYNGIRLCCFTSSQATKRS